MAERPSAPMTWLEAKEARERAAAEAFRAHVEKYPRGEPETTEIYRHAPGEAVLKRGLEKASLTPPGAPSVIKEVALEATGGVIGAKAAPYIEPVVRAAGPLIAPVTGPVVEGAKKYGGKAAEAAKKAIMGTPGKGKAAKEVAEEVAETVSPQDRFKQLYEAQTTPHAMDERYRVWSKGQTAVFDEFAEDPGVSDIHLEMLRVFRDHQGTGEGRRMLDEITRMADKSGATISLEPVAKGGPLSDADLAAWYGREGFEPHPEWDGLLVRTPTPLAEEAPQAATRAPFHDESVTARATEKIREGLKPGGEAVEEAADTAATAGKEADRYFDPEVLKQWRRALNADMSHDSLVYLTPEQFLRMAKPIPGGVVPYKAEGVAKALEEGAKFEDIPLLQITNAGRVRGHEGRHRAMALRDKGVQRIPVRIHASDMRWNKQTPIPEGLSVPHRKAREHEYVENLPEELVGEDGVSRIPFPFHREGPKRGQPRDMYLADASGQDVDAITARASRRPAPESPPEPDSVEALLEQQIEEEQLAELFSDLE